MISNTTMKTPTEKPRLTTRRHFIRQAACAAVGTVALSSVFRDLRLINAAMAVTTPPTGALDYKAMVCIFLYGGNDANNLVLPTAADDYAAYAALRTPSLAIPQPSILPVQTLNDDGHTYGFHPACPELQTLFGEGKLAVLFNTGTLVYPLTPSQFNLGSVPIPQGTFDHPDQAFQWCTSLPDSPYLTGWGGRCADLLASVQPNAPISLTISLTGNSEVFLVGNQTQQCSVDPTGDQVSGGLDPLSTTVSQLMGLSYSNMQARAYAKAASASLSIGGVLKNAIQPTSAESYWTNPFPNTWLGSQLKMAARLIEAGNRSTANQGFGLRRQIFFCRVDGFDLHDYQTNGPGAATSGSHAYLLTELSQSLLAFQRAMEQLGLGSNVATFTASEFGRNLRPTNNGCDHGWGSHHLIMGGAVNGQRTYGRFPVVSSNGPDTIHGSVWLPSIAIDQYFATLASWFGVGNSDLATLFPNLGHFASSNLGFI
jgi:uncharacterized protein (DUF1501 family)